jgi:predicted nucleic acid-binding protein
LGSTEAPTRGVIDANVLFSAAVRDLLIRLHIAGSCQLRWTDRILDECFNCFNAIQAERRNLSPVSLARTRRLMSEAVRGADVEHWQEALPSVPELPDPDDRHVVAAAVVSGAGAIVTWNLKDFPGDSLRPLGVAVETPDQFIARLVRVDPSTVCKQVKIQAAALKNPALSVPDLLRHFHESALIQTSLAIEHAMNRMADY